MAFKASLGRKNPRFIRGYPQKTDVLIRRKKRGGIKWGELPKERIRKSARRPYGVATRQIFRRSLEERAATSTIAPAGSLEERIFYRALQDAGYIPGVDFDFQAGMFGGRAELGGLVADFLFPVIKVIVNPYSDWHTMSLYNERRDLDQISILESMGYTVLTLWPVTIYDQAALDEWIARYITPMWGTSRMGGSNFSGGRDEPYFNIIGGEQILPRIELALDAIIAAVGGS